MNLSKEELKLLQASLEYLKNDVEDRLEATASSKLKLWLKKPSHRRRYEEDLKRINKLSRKMEKTLGSVEV
jgi:KaiC/GvpD/RAD55 family RecA-like ATPase